MIYKPEKKIHKGPVAKGYYRVIADGGIMIGSPAGPVMLDKRHHGVGRFGGDLVVPNVGFGFWWTGTVYLKGWSGPRWPLNLDGKDWEE